MVACRRLRLEALVRLASWRVAGVAICYSIALPVATVISAVTGAVAVKADDYLNDINILVASRHLLAAMAEENRTDWLNDVLMQAAASPVRHRK